MLKVMVRFIILVKVMIRVIVKLRVMLRVIIAEYWKKYTHHLLA